jgi:hypothetical protein
MLKLMALVLIAILCGCDARAECNENSVYCALAKNRPDMERLTLRRIANLFSKYSQKYNQDPIKSVAIGMQETGLQQKNRPHNIIVFNPDGITWRVERGVTDVCMFQFHVDTIVDMNIDPIKLKDNVDYCIEQHFKLMSLSQQKCKTQNYLQNPCSEIFLDPCKNNREEYFKRDQEIIDEIIIEEILLGED